MDIKEVSIEEHCLGKTILLDGVDLETFDRKDLEDWLMERIKALDSYSFIGIFEGVVQSIQNDIDYVYNDRCESCENYNSKIVISL